MKELKLTQEVWNKIKPGKLFFYKGPRRFPFFRKTVGLGRMVYVDEPNKILGIQLLSESQDGKLKIDVAFIPILLSKFFESLDEFVDGELDIEDLSPSIEAWNESGRGCFNLDIYNSYIHIIDTAISSSDKFSLENQYISYAFPIIGNKEVYDTIKARIVTR